MLYKASSYAGMDNQGWYIILNCLWAVEWINKLYAVKQYWEQNAAAQNNMKKSHSWYTDQKNPYTNDVTSINVK
jgi:hypothetical protein